MSYHLEFQNVCGGGGGFDLGEFECEPRSPVQIQHLDHYTTPTLYRLMLEDSVACSACHLQLSLSSLFLPAPPSLRKAAIEAQEILASWLPSEALCLTERPELWVGGRGAGGGVAAA